MEFIQVKNQEQILQMVVISKINVLPYERLVCTAHTCRNVNGDISLHRFNYVMVENTSWNLAWHDHNLHFLFFNFLVYCCVYKTIIDLNKRTTCQQP